MNFLFNCKLADLFIWGYLPRANAMSVPAHPAGGCPCRVAANPAKPLGDFGDAFAVASRFAAALLFGVQ